MPMITLKISHPQAETLVGNAASLAATLTTRWLGKQPELTSVAVEIVPPEHWFVAGRSLAEQRAASFFLEVRITEGTNVKDEKARYVAEVFDGFRALLGEIHPESYVWIIEARADAYGYGGLTSERRYVESRARP